MKYTPDDFQITVPTSMKKNIIVKVDPDEHKALKRNARRLRVSMSALVIRCLKDAEVLSHEGKKVEEEAFEDDDLDSGSEEDD